MPELSINYLAVIACVVAGMPVGYVWFGPLFGKAWAQHMGFGDMEPPGGSAMAKSMALYALGSFLIAFVLAHSILIWQPSIWEWATIKRRGSTDSMAQCGPGWGSFYHSKWVGLPGR